MLARKNLFLVKFLQITYNKLIMSNFPLCFFDIAITYDIKK